MVLADASNGQAVLPAFVLGLVMSSHFAEHREEQERLRVVAFAFLTPFFFIKGGMNVSLGAVVANLGVLAVLLAAKMVPKIGFVYPLARRAPPRHATFATLLMSTGLTFGTISSLYGLNAGIIDGRSSRSSSRWSCCRRSSRPRSPNGGSCQTRTRSGTRRPVILRSRRRSTSEGSRPKSRAAVRQSALEETALRPGSPYQEPDRRPARVRPGV